MPVMKLFLYSLVINVICSGSLLGAFNYFSQAQQITQLQNMLRAPVYLKDRQTMNKEMAEILLPMLEKQNEDNLKRSTIKKPDIVFVPEQLQQQRGY